VGCRHANKKRRRQRKGTALKILKITYVNPLPIDEILLGWSLKHNKGQEGFRDKSEAWKAAFPALSIREF